MMARPISQAGIAKIDQLAENLDSGGSDALTRNDLGKFLQCRCVGLWGKILICVVIVVLASPFTVLSTSPTQKSAEHTR